MITLLKVREPPVFSLVFKCKLEARKAFIRTYLVKVGKVRRAVVPTGCSE